MKLRSLLVLAILAAAVIVFLPADLSAAEEIEGLAGTCLETPLKECRVLSAGYLSPDIGQPDEDPRLAWQTQSGLTDVDGVSGGIVLLRHGPEGWNLLASSFAGHDYTVPQLTDWESGILLHVAAYTGGTGAYNADHLFEYREGTWHPIDITRWLDTIDERLPPGLGIWKGVDYDVQDWFGSITARTPLWREDDGNCCPTGGEATITFTIRDDALHTEGVFVTPPEKRK